MIALAKAAPLETGGQSRMGKDRSGRAFPRALSRHERRGRQISLESPMGNPYAVCCWVQKQALLSQSWFRMTNLLVALKSPVIAHRASLT